MVSKLWLPPGRLELQYVSQGIVFIMKSDASGALGALSSEMIPRTDLMMKTNGLEALVLLGAQSSEMFSRASIR